MFASAIIENIITKVMILIIIGVWIYSLLHWPLLIIGISIIGGLVSWLFIKWLRSIPGMRNY